MKYGLSEKQLNEIITVLSTFTEIEEAILFGSRAIDTYKEASDVDIALKGDKVTASLAAKLKYQFEEDTYLPFFFDFVAYTTITNEALKEHIDTEGVSIYRTGWRECKLGDVSSKVGSGATPTGGENAYKSEGIYLIRSQNVYDFTFSNDGLAFIDDMQAYELRNVEVLENDILINITGESVTRCCIVPKQYLPARVNQHVSIIRPIKEIADFRFVFYYLQSIKPKLHSIAEIGCTRRALTKGMLEDISILLPPLPEQRAIASVLSSLDDKIDLLHRQNKTLETMAETLFRQWFVEEADKNSKISKVTELIEFNPKRQLPKGVTAPYLDMTNVSTSVFHPENWYEREFNSGTKFINGDTLLARITPCLENGKSTYVTFLENGQVGWGSTEFIVMRSKLNLHPFFSYTLARNTDFRDYAEGCLEGTSGRQRVNVDHLANYEIIIPPSKSIQSFNEIVSSIVPKLHFNFEQIRTLSKLRGVLLPKLMSGEVRITETVS